MHLDNHQNQDDAGSSEAQVPVAQSSTAPVWITHRSRINWYAVLASGLIHGAMLGAFNFKMPEKKSTVKEEVDLIQIEMPVIEPDEEEKVEQLSDEDMPTEASVVPMLADIPTTVPVDAFTMHTPILDVAVPPRPDSMKTVSIPPGVRSSTAGVGAKMKDLFNINELDRIPEARFTPNPTYPPELKTQKLDAVTVTILFICTNAGDVVEAQVVKADHPGFDNAAINGISKWKFRPGMKNGKKVNTKMMIPLVFKVQDN